MTSRAPPASPMRHPSAVAVAGPHPGGDGPGRRPGAAVLAWVLAGTALLAAAASLVRGDLIGVAWMTIRPAQVSPRPAAREHRP